MRSRRTHLMLLAAALAGGGAHGAQVPDARVAAALAEFGITTDMLAAKRLEPVAEPAELVLAEVDVDGRRHLLTPGAAAAWHALKSAAAADGITLQIVSSFRSIDRQIEIVRGKLERGDTIDEVLELSAPPGYSEHHSGRVVDLTTPGAPVLDPAFADTDAYRWLCEHAARHGWTLSYPEGNPNGYAFEPWHWKWGMGVDS